MRAFIIKICFIFKLALNLRKQKKFIRNYLKPQLNAHLTTHNSVFNTNELNKMYHYYGLITLLMAGEAMAKLHGNKLKTNERQALTLLSALTGIVDDFFDHGIFTSNEILTLFQEQDWKKNPSIKAKIAINFYQKSLSLVKDPEKFKFYAQEVINSQIKSLEQKNTNLNPSELKSISDEKGTQSLLFYRTCLDAPLTLNETQVYIHFGAYFQFCNDIFDLYKDQQEGIFTYPLKVDNIQTLYQTQEEYLQQILLSLKNCTQFKQTQKAYFLCHVHLISAFSLVALNQLNQLGLNKKYIPSNWTRKELICDTEKFSNRILFIQHFFRLKIWC